MMKFIEKLGHLVVASLFSLVSLLAVVLFEYDLIDFLLFLGITALVFIIFIAFFDIKLSNSKSSNGSISLQQDFENMLTEDKNGELGLDNETSENASTEVESTSESIENTSIEVKPDNENIEYQSTHTGPRKQEVSTYNYQKQYVLYTHFSKNWAQLQAYYVMSEKQASAAFGCAIFLAILGIALIAFAIISPHILNLPTEYSLVPVIGSIAGAVVEVFASTILVVYIKTLSQMSIYHTALADYQRYLSCACLVGELTPEKRDEMYAEIIREEMKKSTFVEVQAKKSGLFGKKSSE